MQKVTDSVKRIVDDTETEILLMSNPMSMKNELMEMMAMMTM